ncbi:MAG: hypothetical protein NT027_01430 [Proteobacteria bacterium]|nr:hypothetical protein [Pseudomonadota bacterium]
MNKIIFTMTILSLFACSNKKNDASDLLSKSRKSDKESPLYVASIESVKAGIDYPTDSPRPEGLVGKKVLLIKSTLANNSARRIIVKDTSSISDSIAGVDYPTDSPVPAGLTGKKILVLGKGSPDQEHRMVINLEKARSGVDFPTDGPGDLNRDFMVWVFGEHKRIALDSIFTIEKAVAGVDFPTDGPADLDRDFYVVTTFGSDGILRNRIP